MLEIPIFLNSVMFTVVASAVPLLIVMFVIRLLLASGKKIINPRR